MTLTYDFFYLTYIVELTNFKGPKKMFSVVRSSKCDLAKDLVYEDNVLDIHLIT